ncbi:MAG: potassium-transporting ATPase subunit KdpC [Bryobacteraceae bacterium]|nr:potassium-transporting ATPase subunit KdpC [Bryobacteraceae bacterium]
MIRACLTMLVLFTVLTGVVYPLAITGLAQLLFPWQAGGSLIVEGGKVKGSELLGQWFTEPQYFWPRLSATATAPYNAASSSGSNYGPHHPDLQKAMRERTVALQAGRTGMPPIDLITASGSGLDPHISPEAAEYQATRVAAARHWPVERAKQRIAARTEGRQWGWLGEPRVNVVLLNRDLDR